MYSHIMINVIKSKLKRHRLYCTFDADFQLAKNNFNERLRLRGYSLSYLAPLFLQYIDRQILIKVRSHKNSTIKEVCLNVQDVYISQFYYLNLINPFHLEPFSIFRLRSTLIHTLSKYTESVL